jgi:hypothetical protein
MARSASRISGVHVTGLAESHADAGGNPVLSSVQLERRLEPVLDAVGDHDHVGDSGHVLEQDHELVSSEAGERISGTDGPLEPFGGGVQELIAHDVPEVVVDLLEAVEVDEEHGETIVGTLLRSLDGTAQPLLEDLAIREAGERVAIRTTERLLSAPLARDVTQDRDEVQSAVEGARDGRCRPCHQEFAAVLFVRDQLRGG